MQKWVYFDTGITWEDGSWCFEFSFWCQIRLSPWKDWQMSIFKIHLSGGLWHPAKLSLKRRKIVDFRIHVSGGAWHPGELTMNKWVCFNTGNTWECGSWCFEFSFWYQIRLSTFTGWKMLIFKIHPSCGVWHLAKLTMKKWVYFDTGITWEGDFWCFEFSFWYQIRISTS